MRWIDISSRAVGLASEAETPTITATRASCEEKAATGAFSGMMGPLGSGPGYIGPKPGGQAVRTGLAQACAA